MEVNSSHNPDRPLPSGPLIRIDTVRSRYIPVTSGGHGYWRGRGKHLGLDTISATIYIYISGHGPWTSSRITRYIYQTATGDEGNWPAWTRPDPPFLLFRNIVIFIKFFHGSGVTHIANVCSPGTDAINQVTNIGGGKSRANERDY